MAGTKIGGVSASQTNKERYGEDFYKKIGQMGGKVSKGGGFAYEHVGKDGLTGQERARIAGSIGGKKSRINRDKKNEKI